MSVRRADELVCRRRLAFAFGGVPRSDNSRVHELVGAVGGHKQFGVLQLDSDRVAGKDIGDVHREHVGTAFFQERGALPFALGALELVLRLLALPDSGHDPDITDGHRHAVDRSPCRCRKDVAGMERPLSAILVHLSNGHVRNHSGNRDVDTCVLERQPIDGGIATVDEEERRERLVTRRPLLLRRSVMRRE